MKGFSKKYSTTLTWRDLAEAHGSVLEELGIRIEYRVYVATVTPLTLHVIAQSYSTGDRPPEGTELWRSRVTLPGNQLPNLMSKMYWLIWDIWQQGQNAGSFVGGD